MPIDNNRKATGLNLPIPSGLVFLIWLLVVMAWSGQSYPRKSYSEFIQQVKAGQVVKATIAKSKNTKAANIFVTRKLGEDPELAKILRTHQVEYSVPASSPLSGVWSILSWFVFPLLFLLLWSRFSGAERQGGPFDDPPKATQPGQHGPAPLTGQLLAGGQVVHGELRDGVPGPRGKQQRGRQLLAIQDGGILEHLLLT